MDETLQAGQMLNFSDDYVIDQDVAAYFRLHGITPAGGERHVYPKCFTLPLMVELVQQQKTSAAITAAGQGVIQVDWGDNTPAQVITLTAQAQRCNHTFDSAVAGGRSIRLYGDAELVMLDLTAAAPSELYLYKPLPVEHLTLREGVLDIAFVALLRDACHLDLQGLQCGDLTPLLTCHHMGVLDLRGGSFHVQTLDRYLLELVTRYGARRSCRLYLPQRPRGDYREPARDAAGAYMPQNGMEAIWIITHEPAWNEAFAWEFILPEKTYTYEPDY